MVDAEYYLCKVLRSLMRSTENRAHKRLLEIVERKLSLRNKIQLQQQELQKYLEIKK